MFISMEVMKSQNHNFLVGWISEQFFKFLFMILILVIFTPELLGS